MPSYSAITTDLPGAVPSKARGLAASPTSGWALHSTTNLASDVWAPTPTGCDNQALEPTALPEQYFRLTK
jgi:hypothetical protein